MAGHLTRRMVLQAGTAVGACAGLGLLTPVMGQPIHTPESQLDRWHRGICGLCGMGDPMFLGVSSGALRTVKGDALSPVGYGRLCTRGMAFPAGLKADRRTSTPLLRRDPASKGSSGGLEAVSWDEAMSFVADRLGPLFAADAPSVGLFLDEGLCCESQFSWNRLFRDHLGSPTVESGTRFGALAGLDAAVAATGLPGPTGTLEDLERADVVLIAGADPAARQATLMSRIVQCRRRGTTRVVLIDPRRTASCGVADIHVRPRVPGTEGLVLRAMAQILVGDGLVDGAEPGEWNGVDPGRAAELSGARLSDIEAAAEAFAGAGTVVSLLGPGLRQPATLFNLHILTDKLSNGSTVIPLTDGANESGSVLIGARCDQRPLHAWADSMRLGDLQAVVALGGNLLARAPGNLAWRAGFAERLLINATPVVPTETTAWSDLVLPLAHPWTEERGCFVNHERRVQLSSPPGPPPDVPTSLELAARFSATLLPDATHAAHFAPLEEYGPELAWEQLRSSSRGTVWDLGGMTYDLLSTPVGLLWPFPDGSEPGSPHATTSARIEPERTRLCPDPSVPVHDDADPDLTHLVTFSPSHHHGGREITGFVPELHYTSPRAWIEINGRDASRKKLSDGSWVAVESPHGVLIARLWITDRVPTGTIAIPEGFGFISDLEGGTDGRGEPESLTALLRPADGRETLVRLREPTEKEMARRALKKS